MKTILGYIFNEKNADEIVSWSNGTIKKHTEGARIHLTVPSASGPKRAEYGDVIIGNEGGYQITTQELIEEYFKYIKTKQ